MNNKAIKKRPKFIVIEGGEGSGKSSLLMALKEVLGDSIFTTREPGGSPYAEVIRNAALKHELAGQASSATMLCLMFAARFDNVENNIVPALERGLPVVSDRFDGSSYAYNNWAQSGGALEKTFWTLRRSLKMSPDLYLFIDVEVEEAMRRAHSRNKVLLESNHFDDREKDFHNKVRQGYLRFIKHVPHIVIDGNRPLEKVKKDFITQVKKYLEID